jgi:hypothetical protein
VNLQLITPDSGRHLEEQQGTRQPHRGYERELATGVDDTALQLDGSAHGSSGKSSCCSTLFSSIRTLSMARTFRGANRGANGDGPRATPSDSQLRKPLLNGL